MPISIEFSEGKRYKEWTIVGPLFQQTRKIDGVHEWFAPCQCSCGNYRAVRIFQLKNGHSNSCGWCEGVTAINQRLYTIWRGMIMRCTNPAHKNYVHYGGRGITVCDEWMTNFKMFRDWSINNGYKSRLQLDRVDNNGNYEPDNCKWVTIGQNNRNKRTNHLVTAFGETKCLMDWILDSRCKVPYSTLKGRLERGHLPEEAITTPPVYFKSKRWANKKITIDGETKSLSEWVKDSRCTLKNPHSISERIAKGMTPEEAIFNRSRKARI